MQLFREAASFFPICSCTHFRLRPRKLLKFQSSENTLVIIVLYYIIYWFEFTNLDLESAFFSRSISLCNEPIGMTFTILHTRQKKEKKHALHKLWAEEINNLFWVSRFGFCARQRVLRLNIYSRSACTLSLLYMHRIPKFEPNNKPNFVCTLVMS